MPRVLFHVQHLLGTGHLSRAAVIARALAASGMEVDLVTGGMPVRMIDPGPARLVQLTPIRAVDESFGRIVDEHGRPIDDTLRAARRDQLLWHFEQTQPDVLITELFPLGRRVLEFELLPLLEAAHRRRPRPLILCSVRDILARKPDAAKRAAQAARARAFYDCVMVHGDPALIPLSASFPEAERIADMIHHTGYVVDDRPGDAPGSDGVDEIVVSAGGGAVGAALLSAAMAARALSAARDKTWRLLVGANMAAAELDALRAAARHAGPGIIVEPARADFPALLRRCHVSVSQAGYNTVMDIVAAAARSVLVPFAAGAETEQTDRAAALAARGWARVVPEAELGPARLAAAIDAASAAARPPPDAIRGDGAATAARLVTQWLTHHPRIAAR